MYESVSSQQMKLSKSSISLNHNVWDELQEELLWLLNIGRGGVFYVFQGAVAAFVSKIYSLLLSC